SVVEDVAEVSAAIGAVDFLARIAELVVGRGADRTRERTVEAGPAGAAVELGRARIEIVAASGADEGALALFAIERRAERALGMLLAQHGVAFRRQPALPFCVGERHLEGLRLCGGTACREYRKSNSRAEPGKRGTTVGWASHGATPST